MSKNLTEFSRFEVSLQYNVTDNAGNRLIARILKRNGKWISIDIDGKLYSHVRVNKIKVGADIESIILEGYDVIFSYQVDGELV